MIRSIITYVVLFISLCPVTYADFLDISKNPEDTIKEILKETRQPKLFEFPTSIIPIIDNFRGWTKLSLPDSSSQIWMPDIFFTSGFTSESNPSKWINKIKKIKFCEPSEEWKNTPIFYDVNSKMTNIFENSIHHPDSQSTINISYSKTAYFNGKTRNVSYQLSKYYKNNSPLISLRCKAENEEGNTHLINQTFDISNPDNFKVDQQTILGSGEVIKI